MFEGLDDINWEQFGDTHIAIGMKTREIPDCVRNMIHPDHKEREFAIACLLGEGQHLGMLSNATPHIIPYVLEVLVDQHYEQRGYLIYGIARMFEKMYFDLETFRYLARILQVYDALKKGYPLYRRLLSDADPEVRLAAVQVLVYMQDNCPDALATLLSQFMVETDTDIRHEIIGGMLKLVKDTQIYRTEGHRDSEQNIISLWNYLKNNGSFDEQVHFARSFSNYRKFGFIYNKEISAFVEQTLKHADSIRTTD
ncbi:MAG: HEAT repeat domain-containing protein [Chloroflexi bacterium]|nr:HEAT repeat domain-containing protein [Chloroflexota bacterium]